MPWLNELVQNQTFSSLPFFLVLLLWSSFSWHTYASLWKVGKSWNAKSIPVCLWNQKNQIFFPPNRQLQSSSPSYKLSASRTMPVPIGSDWRMQSVQTLMPPSIVNVTNSSFPFYFPRQLGWKNSARKVPIIFLRVAAVVELCRLVNYLWVKIRKGGLLVLAEAQYRNQVARNIWKVGKPELTLHYNMLAQ